MYPNIRVSCCEKHGSGLVSNIGSLVPMSGALTVTPNGRSNNILYCMWRVRTGHNCKGRIYTFIATIVEWEREHGSHKTYFYILWLAEFIRAADWMRNMLPCRQLWLAKFSSFYFISALGSDRYNLLTVDQIAHCIYNENNWWLGNLC